VCCGRVQIEFQRHTLRIYAEEFETLLGSVVEVIEQRETREAESWRLATPTDAGSVTVVLDRSALQALYELMAGAQSETTSSLSLGAQSETTSSLPIRAQAMRTLNQRVTAIVEGHRRERPASTRP